MCARLGNSRWVGMRVYVSLPVHVCVYIGKYKGFIYTFLLFKVYMSKIIEIEHTYED